MVAASGEVVTGSLIVEAGVDEGTFIPVTIINGEKPGPVLTLTAGIHGTEYVPVILLQELMKEIDPDELSGTLILVHVANIPAFNHKNVYKSQIDNKNLNRVFPGKIDGSVSERIAYLLTNEIINKSDYFIDLHGGEFSEQIVDYVYFYYGCTEGDLCEKSRRMALAIGNKYLIPWKVDEIPDSVPATYSDVAAYRQGVPVITNEWGDMGVMRAEELATARKGLINVMRMLKMLEGDYFLNENPVYLLNENYIKSSSDGIFYSLADKAQYVTKGTRLGYLTDYWGEIIEEYHSPFNGIVVDIRKAPAVKKGESVTRVAEVADKFEE